MRARVWSFLTCGLLIGVAAGLSSSAVAVDNVSQSRYLSVDPETGEPIELAPQAATAEAALRAVDCGAATGCQCIGDWEQLFSAQNRYRGNAFDVTETSQLSEINFELAFDSGGLAIDLFFSVHGRPAGTTDVFTEVFVGAAVPSIGIADLSDGVQAGDRKFYSSGEIGPVELVAGREYAIGVAWTLTSPFYARSILAHPRPFSDGNVLGQVSKNSVVPPLNGDLSISGIATNGAYSMQICLEPKPGACCLPGGVCSDLTPEDCAGQGEFSEERFLCGDLANEGGCPLTSNGCCLTDGTCANLDRFSCERNGGVASLTMLCADDPCAPRGACCHDDATCSFETQADCESVPGGAYQGDDTNCDDNGAACRVGGCCVDASCVVVTESTCATSLGVFQGLGTDCSAGPCDNPGACCTDSTETPCLDGADGMNQGNCVGIGGTYQGDWSTCATLPTACGEGACCIPVVGCIETDVDICQTVLSGTYRGDGTNCANLDPLCSTGSCCWELACSDDVAPRDCAALPGGVFNDLAVDCIFDPNEPFLEPDPCPIVGARACCLSDGSCIDAASMASCEDQLGGKWDAANTCSAGFCQALSLQACCIDGVCELRTSVECEPADPDDPNDPNAGNVFKGGDCSLGICAAGSCCKDDGECDDTIDAAECRAVDVDGNFYADRTCAEGICPAAGGCCLPDEVNCQDTVTKAKCEESGGAYLGDGKVCAGAVCTREDCCLPNGGCIATLANLCTDAEGTIQLDACTLQACPAAQACCLPDETCSSLTVAACEGRGGSAQGAGSDCANAACARGRCCGYDGVCREGVTMLPDCDPDPGITAAADAGGIFVAGETCSDECVGGIDDGADCTLNDDCSALECAAVCPSAGACCEIIFNDDPVCAADLTADRCAVGANQAFQGLGTSCVNNDCDLGACCREDGSCSEDVLRSDCAGAGDIYHRDRLCREVCPGSCCSAIGACLESTEDGCIGEFTIGGDCATVNCAGTCCAGDGSCSTTSRTACEAGGGSFALGTDCASRTCVAFGACCTEVGGVGVCEDGVSEEACGFDGGNYQGDASICDSGLCRLGGCCSPDGSCPTVIAADCLGVLDEFRTADLTCTVDQCKPRGACCIDGVAVLTNADACGPEVGTYGGDGSDPADVTCGEGACCLPVGGETICEPLTTLESCENISNGSYQGDSSSCPTCSNEDTRACRADADCKGVCKNIARLCGTQFDCGTCEISGLECRLQGLPCDQPGDTCIFAVCVTSDCSVSGNGCSVDAECTEVNETCDPVVCGQGDGCVFGSCCRLDGTCEDVGVTAADCSGAGDLFNPEGICGNPVCDIRGACCSDTGCTIETNEDCFLLAGGSWLGGQTTCDAVDTCFTGVCCTRGNCDDNLVRTTCESGGGVFGPGVLFCDPVGLCDLGSCCLPDDSCEVDTVVAVCDEQGGRFDAGNTCDPAQCVPLGACCRDGLACGEETQADCEAAGGYYRGDDTACADDVDACDSGACCPGAGACRTAFRTQCNGLFDVFTAGGNCSVVTCEVQGSCCVGSECRDDYTVAACEDAGGLYQGDATNCGSVQCSIACTTLTASAPSNCAIDARQPSTIDGVTIQGWNGIEVVVGPTGCTLGQGDLTPSSTPTGPTPGINSVSQLGDIVTITLDTIIPTKNWTCVALTADAAQQVCVGSLPGDVNSDGTSNPALDLGAVIDCINNPGTCAIWQENIDRTGTSAGVLDITRLIDLFNGAGSFDSWTGANIGVACPSE